ncbi:hypothetical protein Fot_19801 [Forsythia ovata]|uniref:Uncharacterized protein n=1 Tax=Forsythia ovata TaxID=205694 RepID=A0ABD1VM16_9LAMI
MSSTDNDSQNPSDPCTDSEIRDEVLSSSKGHGKFDQRLTFAFFPPASTRELEITKIPFGSTLPKAKSKKKQGPTPPEKRDYLDHMKAHVACLLGEKYSLSKVK